MEKRQFETIDVTSKVGGYRSISNKEYRYLYTYDFGQVWEFDKVENRHIRLSEKDLLSLDIDSSRNSFTLDIINHYKKVKRDSSIKFILD